MRMVLASLLMLASLTQPRALAQEKAKSEEGDSVERGVSHPVPVVFGKKNDGLPERLKLRGVITELSFAHAGCGTIFWSGTMKVKLLDRIERYPHENVFVTVPCFIDPGGGGKYLNKIVNLEVSKLYIDYRSFDEKSPCYIEIIINTINSRGVPFYCSNMGQEEIFKSGGRRRRSSSDSL